MGVIERIKKHEREEGLIEGLQKGMEKERARAEVERMAEKLESARKFKAMGMHLEDIAKGLSLSVEEIEKL